MARPSLPPGTFGAISVSPYGNQFRARCLYRDYDGKTRPVERHAKTKSLAERRLKEALRDRVYISGEADITPDTAVSVVAEIWFKELVRLDRSPTTQQAYRDRLDRQIIPGLGGLKMRELSTGKIDRHLLTVTDKHGPGTAKLCRSVLNGIMGLAARHDAVENNPVRDASSISRKPKKTPRALSIDDALLLRERLAANPQAQKWELCDLVDFMLATGERIGEAVAVVWDAVDLEAGTVEVRGTVVRVKGEGLIIKPSPKSKAGFRVLELPSWMIEILKKRLANKAFATGPNDPVFPAVKGGLRDTSNTHSDLRKCFDAAGFEWITSHTFRKSVATWMDKANLSARAAADQLGHAKPSMTSDIYFGRKDTHTGAAKVLEALGHSRPSSASLISS